MCSYGISLTPLICDFIPDFSVKIIPTLLSSAVRHTQVYTVTNTDSNLAD